MSFAIETAQGGRELWIVASGRIGLAEIQQVGEAMREDPRSDLAMTRLVDLREAELDLFLDDIRTVMTFVCGHPERRVAMVAPPGAVFGISRQMESVANNEGRLFKAFTDLEEALRWIRRPVAVAEE